MGKSIYLSPSLQDNNIGEGNYGTEKYRCNQIVNVVEKVLKDNGMTVYRSKESMTLSEAIKDSNNKNPNIHLAVHSNAFNKKSRGTEVFVDKKGGYSEQLAKIVYRNISKITPTEDRGIKEGHNFYGSGKHICELSRINSTAVLIEIDFHDNIDSAKWIIENIELIGIEIAKAVLEYCSIEYRDNIDKNKNIDDKIYRVVVGSYKNIDNAKNHIKILKDKNEDAFIL